MEKLLRLQPPLRIYQGNSNCLEVIKLAEGEPLRLAANSIKAKLLVGSEYLTGESVSGMETGQYGMPPEPEHWPTAEDLSRVEATQPDPRDVLRQMRLRVRPAGPNALHMRLDG